MRKTTALLSATTLGVVAVAAGAVAPASADVSTADRCETFGDHLALDGVGADADWYMECVPQYGLGKAEFTLDAPDSGFPDDVEVTELTRTNSPDASGVAPYYEDYFSDEEAPLDAWINPIEVDEEASTETSLRVGAVLVAPVTSVGSLDAAPAAVAAACEIDEGAEGTEVITFVSNFSPVTTTFSFVGADGVTYSAPVTATPDPTYYVFTNTLEGVEVVDTSVCVTDTHQTVTGDPEGGPELSFIGLITVPPYVWFEDLGDDFDTLPSLGAFRFAAPAAPAEPAPELAATGAENVVPLSIAAGVLGGLGALLFAFARRRRTQE